MTVVEGDIEQGAQLSKALKAHSIHTVVSVVGFQQSHLQYALIDAAKTAGVQHFIPSDFGMDYDVVRPGHVLYELLCKPKQELHAAIKQSGMAWTFIAAGYITDAWVSWPMLGTDLATRTVTAPESFSTTITSTAVRDIGLLTAAAIVDPQARNQQLYTGQQCSYEQVAAALEAATGEKVTCKVATRQEMEAAVQQNAMDFAVRFGLSVLGNTGVVWPDSQTYKYGQHVYVPLDAVARQVAGKSAAQ